MAIDSIGAAPLAANTPQNAVVGQEEFLKILLTQLRFQDPLKPMDNQEFMAQMAQFSGLELTRQQSDRIDTLLTIQTSVSLLSLVAEPGDEGTELSWSTDPGVGPEGLAGYRLYRVAPGAGGEGTRIGPDLIAEARYLDRDGRAGDSGWEW